MISCPPPLWFLISADVLRLKQYSIICCNTSRCDSLTFFSPPIPPSSPSLVFFSSHSARKRMSVIMRTPSGKIRLYCKGAVSVCLSPWQRMTAHHHCWHTHTHTHTHTPRKLFSPHCLSLLSGHFYNEQHKVRSRFFTYVNLCKTSMFYTSTDQIHFTAAGVCMGIFKFVCKS